MITYKGYWFRDPLGDSRKDVYAECWMDIRTIYPGDAFEPADTYVKHCELLLNNTQIDVRKHRAIVDYVLEHGR